MKNYLLLQIVLSEEVISIFFVQCGIILKGLANGNASPFLVLGNIKKPSDENHSVWRRARDSNPRYSVTRILA